MKGLVDETEAKKGADGKRCWKGKRYAGTVNGKDKCIPVKEFAGDERSEQPRKEFPITVYIHSIIHNETLMLLGEKLGELTNNGNIKTQFTLPNSGRTITEWLPATDKKYPVGKLSDNVHLQSSQMPSVTLNDGAFNYWVYVPQLSEGVIVGHDANDPEVALLSGAGTMSLSRLKRKAIGEVKHLADDIASNKFRASAYNIKQLASTLSTIAAAEEEMEKKYFGEDTDMRFAAEKTPAINPYGGQKDRQFRGAIGEDRETYNIGDQLKDIAAEMKDLADNAMNLVRGTPEAGRARAYWYPHIVMAISDDHGYMGKSMTTMMDSAQRLMNGDEDDEQIDEGYIPLYPAYLIGQELGQLAHEHPQGAAATAAAAAAAYGGHKVKGALYRHQRRRQLSTELPTKSSQWLHANKRSRDYGDIINKEIDRRKQANAAARDAARQAEDAKEVDEARQPSPSLRAAQANLAGLASGEVQRKEQQRRAAAKRERDLARQDARGPKKPTLDQIWQKVEHAISNCFPDGDPTDYLNPYMQKTGITWDDITRAAKRNGYKDLWDYWNSLTQDIENDAYADWQAAKRPESPKNPLSKDAADINHRDWVAKKNPQIRTRGTFLETPTDNPTGASGEGGRRKYKPKSAGTFKKESSIMRGIRGGK